MKILHIAAHLGDGAGKAISGMAIEGQELFPDTHRILLLQEPEKERYVRECREHQVKVLIWDGDYRPLQWADVLVVSWWNHPAMARFLHDLPPVSMPMLLWCHVNGCHYPLLPYPFAAAFDSVMLTSPYSMENPFWTEEERRAVRERAEIVWGMGRFAPEKIAPKECSKSRDDFVIGYAGTLNYGKIHPKFTAYCKEVCARIPDSRFVLAGDRDAALERDIQTAGLADRVTFMGFVTDVPALMRTFDVLGYLLNPEHYGTTENVLLEAMACGLPVVTMEQNTERSIVPPEAGYLVKTPEEYGERMAFLRRHPEERRAMGDRARAHVIEHYRAGENTARFRSACLQAGRGNPRSFSFLGDTPWAWFLFCLEERDRDLLLSAYDSLKAGKSNARKRAAQLLQDCSPILRERRKSSLRHFAAIYPEDKALRSLDELLER